MSRIVVDTSVALAWGLPDERDALAVATLRYAGEHGALVPALWPFEVANSILNASKAGRISAAEVARFFELLKAGPIQVEQVELDRVLATIYSLASETGLTAYDAAYLELAMRHGLKLATYDRALRAAAMKTSVVLFAP